MDLGTADRRARVAVVRGRQLQSRDEARGDWWLSAIIGTFHAAVRLPAIVAHLHLRVRAHSSPVLQHASWVCACATQGSERCFARCRLDAVLRQLRSLAHARLPRAVRLPPDRGISAGRRASCRHAHGTHPARCSWVTSRRTASRGSARNRQGRASVVMLQAAAERAFCCGTPPRPLPPSSSRPSSSSPRSHPELVLGVWPLNLQQGQLNLQQAAPLLRQHPQMQHPCQLTKQHGARGAQQAAFLNPVPPITSPAM